MSFIVRPITGDGFGPITSHTITTRYLHKGLKTTRALIVLIRWLISSNASLRLVLPTTNNVAKESDNVELKRSKSRLKHQRTSTKRAPSLSKIIHTRYSE